MLDGRVAQDATLLELCLWLCHHRGKREEVEEAMLLLAVGNLLLCSFFYVQYSRRLLFFVVRNTYFYNFLVACVDVASSSLCSLWKHPVCSADTLSNE